MSITIGYADFVRLFRIEKPNFAPGLELREDGVYVRSVDELTGLISPEEHAILTEHPTGNLSDPALALPCDIKELEAFAGMYSLDCAIGPFDLLKLVERRAFEQAQLKANEQGNYHWPIVARVYGLKAKLERFYTRESNDSKKVVLRDVLDDLEALVPGELKAQVTETSGSKPGRLRSDREENLLRVIAGLREFSDLPKEHHVAADKLTGIFLGWGWESPKEGAIAETILKPAAKLPRLSGSSPS